MKKAFASILVFLAVLLMAGCSASTVQQMYCLPKRSEAYNNLQSAVEQAMAGLEYCAPLTGENQQTVQMADLTGDGIPEYLVFAKGDSEKPLKILIFQQAEETYVLSQIIESYGTAFDQVEYAQMDESAGAELIVGSQVSDQVLRAVSVYTFCGEQMEQLLMTNYTKFLQCDLDSNGSSEILVIRPGQIETHKGIAELYYAENGAIARSKEINMSESADRLKRIITGKLHGGKPAVYVASTVGESAIITDVFAFVNDQFTNVSFSNESGTSVKTLRNYYIYAEDIDADGVVELPDLLPMHPLNSQQSGEMQNVIRWYAMKADGSEVGKTYTYHNFAGGWYLELDKSLAAFLSVVQSGNEYVFHYWNEDFSKAEKIFTVTVIAGQNREDSAVSENWFELYRNDTAAYSACLEPAAAELGITQESLTADFHMIHRDWNTGET